MSLDFNTAKTEASKDEWLSPPAVLAALGGFDLDPCSPVVRPWDTALRHLTVEDDGLAHPWAGRVWLNPPYGDQTFVWLKRLADHGDGVALTFARTETRGFHAEVWERADALFFFKGRLKFFHVDGTPGGPANAPSVLIAYGARNVDALRRLAGSLSGVFVPLRAANDNAR